MSSRLQKCHYQALDSSRSIHLPSHYRNLYITLITSFTHWMRVQVVTASASALVVRCGNKQLVLWFARGRWFCGEVEYHEDALIPKSLIQYIDLRD